MVGKKDFHSSVVGLLPMGLCVKEKIFLTNNRTCGKIGNCARKYKKAELAELVDALDSGSSVRKDFRVQVPGSA